MKIFQLKLTHPDPQDSILSTHLCGKNIIVNEEMALVSNDDAPPADDRPIYFSYQGRPLRDRFV